MRRVPSVAVVVLAAFALFACSTAKGPAEKAIKAAEEALSAAKVEAMKYVPEQFSAVEQELAAAKDSFAKKDYAGATAAATKVAAKAKDLLAAAAARKDEMAKGWEELSAQMPKMIADIKGRIASLSKFRRLPKGIDKSKLEGAKGGLEDVGKAWDEATRAFKAGNVADAFAKAKGAKDKAAEIMSSLGMKVSRAVKGEG